MADLERWKGKIALVTGGTSGIGEEIARNLSGIGMKVAVTGRRADRLEALAHELKAAGGEILPLPGDMRKEEDILSFFPAIRDAWGTVDVLVNNAGMGKMSTLAEGKTEDWRETLDVNVLAVSISIREALKEMEGKEDAQIINISTIYAYRPQVPNFPYYQASKFAVQAMTGTLRAELHAKGSKIKVAMISPGMTATEFRGVASGGKLVYEDYFKDFHPLMPADVCQAALYILSTPSYVQVQDVLLSPMGQGL
ncbi:MAG: SDR family NAD(P)-dependent oxidoreductase [bacterium]